MGWKELVKPARIFNREYHNCHFSRASGTKRPENRIISDPGRDYFFNLQKRSHVTFARSFKLQAESADLISPIFETESDRSRQSQKTRQQFNKKNNKQNAASFTIALIHSVKRRR